MYGIPDDFCLAQAQVVLENLSKQRKINSKYILNLDKYIKSLELERAAYLKQESKILHDAIDSVFLHSQPSFEKIDAKSENLFSSLKSKNVEQSLCRQTQYGLAGMATTLQAIQLSLDMIDYVELVSEELKQPSDSVDLLYIIIVRKLACYFFMP